MKISTTTNRRDWLRQSVMLAGGIAASVTLPISANGKAVKPAFGMKPYKGRYNLLESYHFTESDIDTLKARLLANENPWGPSPKAVSAIGESAARGNRYVYKSAHKLMKVLADKEGVPEDHILMSAGSTDILEKVAFALCLKGSGNIVSADPSYMSLINTATSLGATWKNILLKPDYAHDLKAMEAAIDADTKLVYICNPNNPTGTLTPIDQIKSFCKKVSSKAPVFIDEAYLELLNNHESQTAAGLVKEGYDVIVCRTFSKLHGMAGLRFGYMIAKPERIKSITNLVRTEMGISVTSMEGALASLADLEFQKTVRAKNIEHREYVFGELKKAGMNPIPSHTSFVLFPLQMPAKEFTAKMLEKGVGIRGYEIHGKPYGRVSVGLMDELKLFTKSLSEIIS